MVGLFAFVYENNLPSGRQEVVQSGLQNVGGKPMNRSDAVNIQMYGIPRRGKGFQSFEDFPRSLLIYISRENDRRMASFCLHSHLK